VTKKGKADELYAELQNGADFAELAKKYSQDPGSKDEGGKYEGVQKGQFVPEFDSYLFDPKSKTGVVAEPIKTEFGWHIIEPLSEIKPAGVTPFADVETTIRDQLVQEKKNEAMAAWVSGLEKRYSDKVVFAVGFAPPVTPELPGETGAGETAPATTAAE
jgi:parvulin-like peptidyl-prolyl isomerase